MHLRPLQTRSTLPMVFEAVRAAIWKNLVAFQWQLGDVLAIDNRSVSHGRMPYRGPRSIAVCWA